MSDLSNDKIESPQQLTPWHLAAAVVVLVVPLMIVVGRLLDCRSRFDGYSLTLVLVSLLPPLSMFFVRIKLPGIEVDSHAREGAVAIGSQVRSVRTAVHPPETPRYSPTEPAKKVLATLQRYQLQLFASEPEKRWTFAIGAKAPEYQEFRQGVEELIGKGIAALTPQGQVYLTSEGLETARGLAGELASSPYYQF